MITIKEVLTKADRKKFVKFPYELYKDNEFYVPVLRIDEYAIFSNKNPSYEDCMAKFFLAYKDNKVVGRIGAIIQNLYNKKTGENRIRFTRFDSINDQKVANALFKAVEEWGVKQGAKICHGPLGFNDLEREGLLIEGFDQLGTYEEQYNYDYYSKLIENAGYEKEVDYIEYKVYPPKEKNERFARIAKEVLRRYELKVAPIIPKKQYLEKYKDGVFDLLDKAYGPLYGVVPYTDKVRKAIIDAFKITIDMRFIMTILDKNDKVVAFGLAFPSMSKSVQKSKGKLFPFGLFRIMRELKNVKHIDFELIAVDPEYQGKGVNAIILNELVNKMIENNIEYGDTNLMLEYNTKIHKQWESFNFVQNKRRRCYKKVLKVQ